MPIRRSPNGAAHTPPQTGRNRPEWVVAINRNAWSQSIGTGGRNHPECARNPGIIEHLALVPMPATGAALAGGDASVIPAGTKNVVQAAKWIAFINSRDVQVKVGVVAKLGPSRNDARQAPEIQSDPFLSFRPPADALYAPYNTPKWGKLQTVLYDIVQSALLGDETPEEALKSGEKKLNAILAE